LVLQKILENKLLRLFFLKNSKSYLIVFIFLSSLVFELSKAESNNVNFYNKTEFKIDKIYSKNQLRAIDINSETMNQTLEKSIKNIASIDIDYLSPKNQLEDYIIDSGDELFIDFYPAKELSDTYLVNAEGELFLPRIDNTFVRGLTTSELKNLLERRYLEFLVKPEIKISIAVFRPSEILVQGEVRYSGLYKFPAYRAAAPIKKKQLEDYSYLNEARKINNLNKKNFIQLNMNNLSSENKSTIIEGSREYITTISDVIRKAGGITSLTDLSRIEIIRPLPIGKGGGKKRAYIDLSSFVNNSDDSNDLRVFDGDIIFIPKLIKSSTSQISKSIITGLSPKFITVNIFGQIKNPGSIKVPLGATLSDAFDLTGPIKPLSGKVVLFRYQNDGTILRKKISYSASSKRGSKRNPLIKEGDFISVKNSFLGKSTDFIREFTAPFIGINAVKDLFESFSD
tara:strand:- start:2643 stop:4007 length:1365 start_codon:yes stop_codon:yes gene_type:complete